MADYSNLWYTYYPDTVIPLWDTSLIHRSGRSSSTQIREYVNTRRTIHPSIHSRWLCVLCGRCTCLEFLATQCSVHVVAGILLSTSKDSSVHCVISSLALNAVLELNFVQCPCNSSVIASLKSYSFIHYLYVSPAYLSLSAPQTYE